MGLRPSQYPIYIDFASITEVCQWERLKNYLVKFISSSSLCCRFSALKRTGKRLAPANLCSQINLPLRVVTLLLMLLLLWGVTFTIFQDAVLPQGKVFALATLFILAYLAGWLISLIHLPPLLGMLVAGILLRNIGFFHMTGPYAAAVSTLR